MDGGWVFFEVLNGEYKGKWSSASEKAVTGSTYCMSEIDAASNDAEEALTESLLAVQMLKYKLILLNLAFSSIN